MPFCTHWTSQTLLSFLLLCIFQKEKKTFTLRLFEKVQNTFSNRLKFTEKFRFAILRAKWATIIFTLRFEFSRQKTTKNSTRKILLAICIQLHIWKISDSKSVCKYSFWCENWTVTFFGDFRRRHLCRFSNTMNRSIEIAMHCSRDNLKNNL